MSYFFTKTLDMDPTLVKKILKRRVSFHKICENNVKSAVFEAEKPLEMGLDLGKFRKNCLFSRFLSEKILTYG